MTAIIGFGSVSPSSSSESANESGSESSENSCVSSGKDFVSYDESWASGDGKWDCTEYAAQVAHEEQQEAEVRWTTTVTAKAKHSTKIVLGSLFMNCVLRT